VFAEDIVMTGHNNGDVMGLFSGGKGWASGLLGTIEEKMIE
jgi:hypothetical protein